MPFRTKPLTLVAGVAGAGFSFNRFADRDARSTARRLTATDADVSVGDGPAVTSLTAREILLITGRGRLAIP